MRIAVTGSIATDHLMVFDGRFADSLLVEQLDKVSLSFLVNDLQIRRGGVAANIAYHLRKLGEEPVILAGVGSDFGPYAEWLDKNRIRRDHIKVFDDVRTPQGWRM